MNDLDVVYAYKRVPSEEILWSIKSLKNLPHRNIYVIGDDPGVEGIIVLPTNAYSWGNFSKYHNQIAKYLTACEHHEISSQFIAMNDDFFVMNEWSPVNYNRGTLRNHIAGRRTKDSYTKSLISTTLLLNQMGLEDLDYELHTPFVFDKSMLKKLIESLTFNRRESYQIRSLYGNAYSTTTELAKDVKNPDSPEGMTLISTDNKTFKGKLGDYIRSNV